MANIIVFGPHPDDQELGMGGSIARFAEDGHNVLIVDVTDGSPTPRGNRESRLAEAQVALEALQPSAGKPRIKRVLLGLTNRMVEHNLASRHAVAGLIRAHQASIIFTPWPEDAHPDHRAVTRNVEDARFDAKLTSLDMPVPPGFESNGPPIYPKWLIYYHASHLRATITPSFILDITGYEHRKIAATKAYKSQFGPFEDIPGKMIAAPSPPAGALVTPDLPDRLAAFGAYMGSLIGTKSGEPFFTKEPIGLSGLSCLVQ